MSADDPERRHVDVHLTGFRSRAAAVGLLQLVKELRSSGALTQAAVDRIRDAVADEFTVTRPIGLDRETFRSGVVRRLDQLLGDEKG